MTNDDDTPTTPTPDPEGRPPLRRSSSDRVLYGVCGGLATHLGVDPALVRIVTVALLLVGGAGLVLYVAALLLIPEDGVANADAPARTSPGAVGLLVAVVLVISLVLGGVGAFWGFGFVAFAGAVLLVGLAVWWLASGTRPSGEPRTILRSAASGLAMLVLCSALAVGSLLAAALGGGTAVAIVVVLAGAGLVVAALRGHGRRLVLPALAVALPAAFVSAVDLDLHGGAGDERYAPATTADLRPSYRLGVGQLVVDLRRTHLTPGDHRVKVSVGAGHALVIVPPSVCVTSSVDVGAGQVSVYDHGNGGLDVDWRDGRRARPSAPRLVLDGDVGLGFLEVADRDTRKYHRRYDPNDRGRSHACAGDAPLR